MYIVKVCAAIFDKKEMFSDKFEETFTDFSISSDQLFLGNQPENEKRLKKQN